MLALAAGLLLGAVLLGQSTPLRAQDGDGTPGGEGVSIRLGDLSSYPTHTTLDRFTVDVANLTSTVAYQVTVSSDNAAALGIGGCGTATQTRTVTGTTASTLTFIAYACAVGGGTVTADVRPAGASSPAATVSQRLSVEPVPETAPGAEAPAGQSAPQGQAQVTRPGAVPSISFPDGDRKHTSVKVTWGAPSDGGGRALTGFGLLFWRKGTTQPAYSKAFVVGAASRSHTYTGLQPNTTYQFRIHACNGTGSCGWWTNPPKEVTTRPPPPTPKPTARPATAPGKVRALTATGGNAQISVTWQKPTSSGSSHLTGYHVQHRQDGAVWPVGADIVTPGTKTNFTIGKLTNGKTYDVRVRACNGASLCGAWVADEDVWVPPPYIHLPKDTIEVGERMKIGAHDVPTGAVAYLRIEGPIQPEGRCQSQGSAQQRGGPRKSTGPGYYDSMWIDGCAPGDAKIRLETANGATEFARAKFKVVAAATERPGRVARPQITEYNAALKVAWSPPANGGAPRHYDVRDRAGSSGAWRQRRSPDNQSMILDQLTNGVTYEVQVRACNQHGCSLKWSETATGIPSAALGESTRTTPIGTIAQQPPTCDKIAQPPPSAPSNLAAPSNLDLTPSLTTRHAQLAWAPVSGTAKYRVEVRRLEKGAWGAWGAPDLSGSSTNSGEVTKETCYDINLDHIVEILPNRILPNPTRGLGTNVAFGFRVKAINGARESDFSNEVIVIDFSRAYANGDSRGYPVAGQGQAEVNWQRADQVLGSNYRSGQYSFRYRELRHKSGPGANSLIHHSDPSWQPNAYVTIDTTTDNPKTGLTLGTIYGVQIRLDNTGPGGTTSVYAARDIYAWPHHESAYYRQHVVATHDFRWTPIFRATSSEAIVYRYRICTDTFTFPAYTKPGSSLTYKAADPAQWVAHINHALRQWQYATNGLVQMIHEVDAQGNSLPCSNTLEFLTAIADEYNKRKGKGETASDIDTHITNYLKTLKEEGIKGRRLGKALAKDLQLNEILMVDNVSGSFATFPNRVFKNVSAHVGIPYCGGGCALVEEHVDPERPLGRLVRTADIYLNRMSHWSEKQTFVDLRGVDQIRLNTCPNTKPDNREEQYHRPYGTLVHEAGHALGLDHPTNLGPVMSYTRGVPQCSPHPFDVLALMALYQSRGERSA